MEAAKSAISNLMGYNKDEDATTGTGTTAGTTAHTTHHAGDNTFGKGSLGQTSSDTGSAPAHHATTTGTNAETDYGTNTSATTGTYTDEGTGATSGASAGSSTGPSAGHSTGHSTGPSSTRAATGASSAGSSTDTDHGHKSGVHLHNPLHHHKSHDKSDESLESSRSHAQSPSQGRDPAVVGDDDPARKLTGTAAPGSHSAVFGLTPSGEKVTDTRPGTGIVKPASELGKSKSGNEHSSPSAGAGDTSSRAPAGGKELSEQMHNPRDQGPKGLERTDPVTSLGASDSDKPGAGGVGLHQGTGDVRPGERGGDA